MPPIYPDETPSGVKGKTQAPPASGGINLRKEQECGTRLFSCVPGLNTKSKAAGLCVTLTKSLYFPVPVFV